MRCGEIDRLEHRMGDEHHGLARAACQSAEQVVVELEAGDLVERRERLVHQQQRRLGDQRARDRDAHLHAAGQLARIGVARSRRARPARSAAATRAAGVGAAAPAQLERQPTLRATVAHGISVGSWNTKPISPCRAPACAAAPGHSTVPRVGSLRPAIMRSAVDLPQPDGPSSETNSPGHRSRLKRSSAMTPLAKVLPTPCSETEKSAVVVRLTWNDSAATLANRTEPRLP